MIKNSVIAAVIPCYKVKKHIQAVVQHMPQEVDLIYIIDDCCPEHSAGVVAALSNDSRIRFIHNEKNLGVGGAVMAGYRAAIADGADILVKVDGDGQMNPALIPKLVAPIIRGNADYTKGNRFFNLEKIRAMPNRRLFGNAILSLLAKLSTGYWDLFDPTNGFTAIHAEVAALLPFDKISKRYFFETDLLFRLNTLRAVVLDIPMDAQYGNEISQLKIFKIMGEFFIKHLRNMLKRLFYNYYLRNMSPASVELPIGLCLFFFGLIFGSIQWWESAKMNIPTPTGTIMIVVLSLLAGLQFILGFLNYDMNSSPKYPLHLIQSTRESKS